MLKDKEQLLFQIRKFVEENPTGMHKDIQKTFGISRTTFERWMRKSKQPNPLPFYVKFGKILDRFSRIRTYDKPTESLMNDNTIRIIEKGIQDEWTQKKMYETIGIGQDTWYSWIKQAKKKDQKNTFYKQLGELVDQLPKRGHFLDSCRVHYLDSSQKAVYKQEKKHIYNTGDFERWFMEPDKYPDPSIGSGSFLD